MLQHDAIEPPPSYTCGVSVLPSGHVRSEACHKHPGGGLSFDAARSPNLLSGCYLMNGADGRMLYAGKAVGLRKRLSAYLLDSKTRHRKVEMIARIGVSR